MPKSKMSEQEEQDEPEQFVEIPYRGAVLVIPRDRGDWSTEGLAYLAESKYNLFVMHTLEIAKPGQWKVLCRLCPRRRDFAEFFALFGAATEGCVN
jgi:hypothetical protein